MHRNGTLSDNKLTSLGSKWSDFRDWMIDTSGSIKTIYRQQLFDEFEVEMSEDFEDLVKAERRMYKMKTEKITVRGILVQSSENL